MKIFNRVKYIVLLVLIISISAGFKADALAAQPGDKVDIIFTSDLHSNIMRYGEIVNGQQKNVGGFAALKTLIDQKRAENPDTLVIDCGDIVMGTFSQALMDTEAVELRLLSSFGYDAITYGNHEFDYGAKALADMYSLTANVEEKYPSFVICNVDWNQADEYTQTLKKGMEQYGYADYVVIEKGGVRIAITGVLGYDAIKCAPTCELTFKDPIEAVKATVKTIKEKENPDMIVCLSHSGTGTKLGDTEDENLAKEVPDLDVIVSGHTHTFLQNGIDVGDTHILSCGAYGLYTGDISFTRNSNNRWDMTKYNMVFMDESIEEDQAVLDRIAEVNEIIDETVLKNYGLKALDVIATNENIIFENEQDTLDYHREMKLCNLLSDSYRYAANNTPAGKESPFDAAVVPSGTVRDTFVPGPLNVSDAFCVLSLGVGPDGNVGYPLVSLYLTGKEIRTIAEVDASISDLMPTARLYTSGIGYEFNPNRLILNKTVDVWCTPAIGEDSYEELDNDKLYHIVTDSYSMSMLGAVTDMSKGILSVIPKDKDGNPITNNEDQIIYDENGNELKGWIALVDYLDSFPGNEQGVSVIPRYYAETRGRKVVNDSFTPRALFKNTSKYFVIIVAILLLIILLIIIIIRSIVRKVQKKKIFK